MKENRAIPWGCLLLVSAGLWILFPDRLSAQEWIPQRYTTRNGLPQNSVLSLAVDSVGFLWITTEGGVARFDGDRFKHLPISSEGTMGPERMRQLIPTLEKDLFVNDSRGEVYLIHGHMAVIPAHIGSARPLTITGGFPGRKLFAKALDQEHPVPGRSRWPGLQLNVLPVSAHDWYVQCDGLLLAYRDSSLVDSVVLPAGCSRLFLNGGHVFGLDGSGAFRADPGQKALTRVRITDEEGTSVDLDNVGRTVLWTAGDPNAYLYNAQEVQVLRAATRGNGLVAERVHLDLPQACRINALVVSEAYRMVAVGTDTKGLFIYHPKYMRTIVAGTEGATGNSFYAQATLPDGGVLAATNDGRVTRFDRTGRVVEPSPIPAFGFGGVSRDREGGILYSPNPGLVRYDPVTGEKTAVEGAPGNTTFSRFLQEDDQLWVTDEKGIHRLHAGSMRLVFAYTGDEAFRHAQFLRRRDADRLWFGTCNGLYSLTTTTGEVDTIDEFRGRCVRAMERIGERVFVGTYGSGAFVQDGTGFRALPMDPLGYMSHVHAFLTDENGRVWMSTNQGMFRMRLQDVETVLADTSFTPYLDYFGEWAGIENNEFNGGCDPPCVRLSDGTASFPTLGGLVWFKPEAVPDMRPSSTVLMEEVLVDGRVWPKHQALDLGPDTRAVEVRFSLPYWGDPENVHLEYWLKGRPGGWAPLDHGRRLLRFRDLAPGTYELLVRKTGSTDITGAGRIGFNVRKWFYQRTSARIGLGALAVLVVWALLRLNQVRLRRINRRLEERVGERTRELEEANRELRASMELKQRLVSIISHDIVTPLRFIERVARAGARTDPTRDAADLSETLRDISFSAEKLYANARNTLSWIKNQEGGMELRPMHVALNPLVEEVCDVSRALALHKGLRLENEVSLDDVVRLDRDVISIILHNLITNAITHTGRGEVRVLGEQVDGGYAITVADTGHGMSTQALEYIRSLRALMPGDQRLSNEEGIQGLGYVIIIELVRLLGGQLDITSTRETGTRVIVRLPV